MNNLFFSCSSLISLDLNNFVKIASLNEGTQIFQRINSNLTYCINETNISTIYTNLLNRYTNNCSDICFLSSKKIIYEEKKCVINCKETNNYKYEYNNMCYKSCPNGTHISHSNSHYCEDDLICEEFYNYNHTECLDYIPEGYFLNDSNLKTIDKCDIKCKTCSLESNILSLCISCNNNKGFYQKFNESNESLFVDCFNVSDGYYLDISNKIYKPCFYTCKNCNESGNEKNNNCIECKNNYSFIEYYQNHKNCYKNCAFYYYFDSSNELHCTLNESCPNDYNKLISTKKQCIENCSKDSIYKKEYNNRCYIECPNGYYTISNVSNVCINNSLNNCLINWDIYKFFKGNCNSYFSNNLNSLFKDAIINNIKEDILTRKLIYLILKEKIQILL